MVDHHETCREYPDLQAALADAQGAARAVVTGRLHKHRPPELRGSLDIEDEQRRPVARIMLADLVSHCR